MFPNRELRVLLNDHQKSPKKPSVSGASKVKVSRRHRPCPLSSSRLEKPEQSKAEKLKNPLFNMGRKTEPSTTPKRQTRASTKTSPTIMYDDPEPRTRKRKKPKTSGTMEKSEDAAEVKEEITMNPGVEQNNMKPLKRGRRRNPEVEKNNNVEPSKKRRRRNPAAAIDLEDSEIFEIKREEQSGVESLLDNSELTINSTISKIQLNDSGFDGNGPNNHAADGIEARVNDENNQNYNNEQKNNILMRGTRGANVQDHHSDVENMIEDLIDVIRVEEAGGTDEDSSESAGDEESTKNINSTPTKRIPDLGDTDDPRETKMKCLSEIISDVFDLKLPESEERNYFLLKQVLEEYKREKKFEFLKSETERKKYERAVSSNIQGIKMILTKMNRRKMMVDQTTQTDEEPLEEPKDLESVPEEGNPKKEIPPAASKDDVPGENQQSSDDPAGDLTGMIVLDSVSGSNDHQGSVFQRLGERTAEKFPDVVMQSRHQLEESPENPSPGPLTPIELQQEMIERRRRECNIVITGFRRSWKRLEDELNDYFWRTMGVRAGVVKVEGGHTLVVTVASHRVKQQILKKKKTARFCHVRIHSDYTLRERQVQMWLGDEERRRNRAGGKARATYGRININGLWWHWDELQGRLTRSPFRPDLIPMETIFARN